MSTECNQKSFSFHPLGQREVRGRLDGGASSSEGGGLLLREVEKPFGKLRAARSAALRAVSGSRTVSRVEPRTGILRQFSACFVDHRKQERTEHTVEELVGQRVRGLALGYEDRNDQDQLRSGPLLAVLAGPADPSGESRRRAADCGKALACQSTVNRLELTPADATEEARYKKIVRNPEAIDRLLLDVFWQAHREAPRQIVLDLDATDDPLHGQPKGRFFQGCYPEYGSLPFYIFGGEFLLCARLRPSHVDASAGAVEERERMVGQMRALWPEVQRVIGADSGFCREAILAWCEQHGVDSAIGLAKNQRLRRIVGAALQQAQRQWEQTGHPARVFTEFDYQTRKSWSRQRRGVGQAEYRDQGENPRFVVTSLTGETRPAQSL